MRKRLIPRQKFVVANMALLVVGSLGVILFFGDTAARAWSQATSRQLAPYSALSFVDTGNLPTYAPAGKPKHMTFRLTNQETVTTTYRYRVVLDASSGTNVLAEGTVTLAVGASIDKTITFTLPQPEMNAQVIVQLVDRTEYITFGTAS